MHLRETTKNVYFESIHDLFIERTIFIANRDHKNTAIKTHSTSIIGGSRNIVKIFITRFF